MRLPLFPPGEIIVPSHRAAVIAPGEEILQKVATVSYDTQLVFLLLPEWGAWLRLTQCPLIVVISVCQVSYLRIQCLIIGPCNKKEDTSSIRQV